MLKILVVSNNVAESGGIENEEDRAQDGTFSDSTKIKDIGTKSFPCM